MSTKKRSQVTTQNVMVTKTAPSSVRMSLGTPGYGGNVMERTTIRRSYAAGVPALKTGVAGQVTKEGVNNVLQTRDKEREEMNNLNCRFADLISNKQLLEQTCTALTAEIDRLKKAKNYDQQRVADLYKEEIEDLRNIQKELEQKGAPLDSKIIAKEDEIETLLEKIKDLENCIRQLDEKCRQLGDENGDLEGECKKLKNEVEHAKTRIAYLEDQLNMSNADNKRLRNDLEEAICAQINASERAKDAEEQLEFDNQALTEEINGLREILKNINQKPFDIQGIMKKNFGSAVEKLQDSYREELARVCDENKRQYEERLRTIQMGLNKENADAAINKSEVKTVKSQLTDHKNRLRDLDAENAALRQKLKAREDELEECREDCEKEKENLRCNIEDLNDDVKEMIDQIEGLKDKKCSLELEIATYRKLLEGEEQRGLHSVVSDSQRMRSQGGEDLSKIIMGGGGGSSMQSTMSESTGRINVKKTSKCAVSISDISHEGAYVKLENTSATKDCDIGGWSLERKFPRGVSRFTFPAQFTLRKGQAIKIFGADCKNDSTRGRDDIVADAKDCPDWGYGNGSFTLRDNSKPPQEKACSTIEFK